MGRVTISLQKLDTKWRAVAESADGQGFSGHWQDSKNEAVADAEKWIASLEMLFPGGKIFNVARLEPETK